ncbi:alpha/beta fold hydrolase [Solimonas marina]|uniref:Alpha/beta fold hydrolase n=1 Tax=Solimonas marina TaxID=2714601 RepID=A0A970B8A2_9GAMM|nr:alpha/beta hydrolase [Solimonas marina]NKF24530.1 alpha/beta fold hydrolase [Solimonas marina]
MPYAAVNGQNLYYEDSGSTRPVVVFSHGLLMDHEMFAPQVDALRERYRCIVWDERGHGLTAGGTLAPFSYYDSADDLVALLDHLGIESAVLAGMSQGGYLSLRCALRHPQRVRALVLIDTQAQTEDATKTAGYRQMIDVWAQQGLPQPVADTIAQIILGAGWAGAAVWQDKWRGWQPHNLLGCFQALVSRDDVSDRLRDIEVPALVVHGEADAAIALDRARDMAGRLPDAELVVVPGAGHAANLTNPQPVNAAILRFLEALDD